MTSRFGLAAALSLALSTATWAQTVKFDIAGFGLGMDGGAVLQRIRQVYPDYLGQRPSLSRVTFAGSVIASPNPAVRDTQFQIHIQYDEGQEIFTIDLDHPVTAATVGQAKVAILRRGIEYKRDIVTYDEKAKEITDKYGPLQRSTDGSTFAVFYDRLGRIVRLPERQGQFSLPERCSGSFRMSWASAWDTLLQMKDLSQEPSEECGRFISCRITRSESKTYVRSMSCTLIDEVMVRDGVLSYRKPAGSMPGKM